MSNAILIAPHPRIFEIILTTEFALAETEFAAIMTGPSGVHQWVFDNAVGIYVVRFQHYGPIVSVWTCL